MKSLLTAVLALSALAPATAGAALPDFANQRIVPGKSIGGMAIGQAPDAAKAAWGGGEGANCGSDGCIWTNAANGVDNDATGRARFNFRDEAVTLITLEAPEVGDDRTPRYTGPLMRLKTSKGVGLGTKVKRLRKKYPKVKKEGTFYALEKGGVTTQFAFVGKRISDIYITIY